MRAAITALALLLGVPRLSNPSAVNGHGYSPRQVLIAPDFCTDGGGVCLSDAGGVLPPVDTGTPTTLYVSTTGNDSNACTASGAAACLTIEGARRKIPKLLQHHYTIQVGAGTFSAGAYVQGYQCGVGSYTPSSADGPALTIQGTMQQASLGGQMSGNVTSAFMGYVPNGSIGSPSPNIGAGGGWGTVTVTGAGWTTNALAGYPLCITGGDGAGQCVEVWTNTATVATIVGSWPLVGPDSTSQYEIETWGTTITGSLLPRPPGGAGYANYSSTYSAAFFVGGNDCPGAVAGYGTGFGNDVLQDGGFLTNSSFVEPPISIHGFKFTLTDAQTALAVNGADNLVDFSLNYVNEGTAVQACEGAQFYAIANSVTNDSFGTLMFANGNIQRQFAPTGSGFEMGFGNYCLVPSSGGYTSCFAVFGPATLAQNFMGESDDAGTESGILYGNSATLATFGNEFWWVGFGVNDYSDSFTVRQTSYNDDFQNVYRAWYLRDQSSVMLDGTNQCPTGANVSIIFELRYGATVYLNSCYGIGAFPLSGSVADIQFDAPNPTSPTGNLDGQYSITVVVDGGWGLFNAKSGAGVYP